MDRLIQYWRIYNDYLPWVLLYLLSTLLLFLLVYSLRSKTSRKSAILSTILEGTIFFFVIIISFITLLPIGLGESNLISLQSSITLIFRGDIEYVLNLIIFIPLGLSLSLRMKNTLLTIGIGFLFSLTIEIIQYIFPIGRIASIDDLLLNTLGTLIGSIVGLLISRFLQVVK